MNEPSPNNPPDTPEIAPAETVEAETVEAVPEAEVEIPVDPEALAADRAGFKFLAFGFLFFFVIIAVCASLVALVMKNMGI